MTSRGAGSSTATAISRARPVGVIGLGEMGRPMAANLLRKGFTVVGYDVDPAALASSGVRAARSPSEVADGASAVIVLVRDLAQTEAVLFGPAGVFSGRRAGLDLIVMSTIDPAAMVSIATRADAMGASTVDAPVSGGVAGAEAGTLTVMVGGDLETVERCRDIFEAVGEGIFVIGPRPGLGQAVKLANQLMLAASLMGTLEGLSIVARAGLEPSQALEVIARSTGSSWPVLNFDRALAMWEGAPDRGALGIVLKDLRSIGREAFDKGLELPLARLALEHLLGARERARLD